MATTGHGEVGQFYWNLPGGEVDRFISTVHVDDRARVRREVEAALVSRGGFALRAMIVLPSGELRTFDIAGEVVLEDGLVSALKGTTRDVTTDVHREARIQFYTDVFAAVQIGLSAWQLDRARTPPRLRLVACNPAFANLAGAPLTAKLGHILSDVFPEFDIELLEKARAMTPQSPILRGKPFRLASHVMAPVVSASFFPLPGAHVGLALEDVTARYRDDVIHATERRALEMLAAGAELPAILDVIVRGIEEVSVGTIGSILLVDETGTRVRHGAAPRLPAAFIAAIDGTMIGPSVGSCGTAVYRREPVFVEDIEIDPLWSEYRHLAHPHGLRSCWSVPIFATTGQVLGSFALYHKEPRAPDDVARETLARASHVTAIVLERRALDEQLRALAARLDATREDERTSIARDIHDQLGQVLTALKLDIGWLARRATDPPIVAKLDEMAKQSDEIIRTVRRISTDLRPGILDDIGLAAAIEWQGEEFAKSAGVKTTVHADLGDVRLDRELATALFRIFQESLTNIARHASAKSVDVRLAMVGGKVELVVIDDGVGLPDVGPRGTLGILGMGERARRLGGECTVKRGSPAGTIVSVVMPARLPTVHTG